MTIRNIANHLEEIAPLKQAEDFDNVGLLIGNYTTKVTGVLVTLDTLDSGQVKVTIPPGTKPGTKFSINGHGMPDLHSGRRGNMYVTINAKVPKGLSQDEITMLQKLRKRLDKKGIDY